MAEENSGMVPTKEDSADESTSTHVDRLSYSEAKELFEDEYAKFQSVIDDVDYAITHYKENSFTVIQQFIDYENMWRDASTDARNIQNTLLANVPPQEWETHWYGFAECMGTIADALWKGTNMNPNNDDWYTDEEMDALNIEITEEFALAGNEACDIALAIMSTTVPASETNDDLKHYCVDCGEESTETYTNPFSGEEENYCSVHYNYIIDTIQKMEDDVKNAGSDKHTCEQCDRPGTNRYDSFTGRTEYYCTTHYKELIDMLKQFGLD